MKRNAVFASLLVMGIVVAVVLGLYQTSQAATKEIQTPFNSVKQRLDMINELRVIADLLKEQNKLLREQNLILQKQINQRTGR